MKSASDDGTAHGSSDVGRPTIDLPDDLSKYGANETELVEFLYVSVRVRKMTTNRLVLSFALTSLGGRSRDVTEFEPYG
jgi:hypothetical protein